MDIVPEGQAPLSFAAMELPSEILRALEEQGITTPTLIQQRSIPLIASGHDVIGMSKTGSGKTIAFGAPCLQLLASRAGVQVLILAPTRELAVQIAGELRKLGKYLRFSIATVYGGVALGPQVERIERSEVVVGTPGRILDHLERGSLRLDRARCVVLDEADKMAEMGFIEDVQRIMDKTPEGRQVLLFGATLTDDIERITKRYMRSPTIARAEAQVEGEYLQQFFYEVEAHEKFSLLVHLLQTEQRKQSIVFCSRISTCEMVARNLQRHGVSAALIHGKLPQASRLKVIDSFNQGREKLLVASPVAARGLDIREVSHVFNYDLSEDPEEYVHRIGRTARAGDRGKAITLLSARDYEVFSEIQNSFQLEVQELPRPQFRRLGFQARIGGMQDQRYSRARRPAGNRSGSRSARPLYNGNNWPAHWD